MNPEEFKNGNNNSRRYFRYFFYGWVFFAVLMLILLNWAAITTDLMWGLILFVPVPFFLALFITPLIVFIIRDGKILVFIARIKAYFRRFLFPLYLFPVKIVTYSTYYLIRFFFRLLVSLLKIIRDFIVFPFRSLKNFLKAVFITILVAYVIASFVVNVAFLQTHYGWNKKFFTCTINKFGINEKVKNSVVRIVGGFSEGSGFFIQPNQIVTNFHVIAGEPSPKIIFPDGNFIVPERIVGDKDKDLAIIFTQEDYPNMVMDSVSADRIEFYENEALFATGYPMGTDLIGSATQLKGNYIGSKEMNHPNSNFIQTNISLAEGMSGGPLTDQCGTVFGVNTMTIGGTSLFIPVFKDLSVVNNLTDKDIIKIKVDPAASPQEAVWGYYVFLKARRMEDSFNLLSKEYLRNTDFWEWNNRFLNVIDVDVIKAERQDTAKDKNVVYIKFTTKNWVNGGVEMHYYEGTWQTVMEDGINKLLKSNIKEILEPDKTWFYY